MKRLLLAAAALAVLATAAFPAAALNPQPLPPKIFKNSDLLKRQIILKKKHYYAR